MSDHTPYISIVLAAPDGAESLAERFGLSAEVIVVAPDMKSRNAGIRRALGEFILCADAGLRFSDELMKFLASRQLQKGRLYRIDVHEGNGVHAREGSFSVTADGIRENDTEDIAGAQSGIHFGDGWFATERDAATGEIFRWIESAAEVIVRVPEGGGALALELEPGPGVGPLPQVLQVLDRAGAQVAEWTVGGRLSVQLWVPAGTQSFRFSVPDGGRALLDDLRILNFRFFRCDWVRFGKPAPGDVTMARLLLRYARSSGTATLRVNGVVRLLRAVGDDIFGAGVEYWGQGWHRLEQAGTTRFRWISTDAELVVRIAGQPQDLCMLVEPGPSLNGQPFQLIIRLAGGREIGRVKVKGLTLVRVPIPVAAGEVPTLFLTPDAEGQALPGDSRVLNFRVLACACEASKRPAAKIERPDGWTVVTVSERPAAIDWPARLHDRRYELAEIGKPAFLHVNACDFVLMDRDLWHNVRGYPEADGLPEHLQMLLCYAAHFAGAREEVLRAPLRVDREPHIAAAPPDADLIWMITQMRRLHAPTILNPDSWGGA